LTGLTGAKAHTGGLSTGAVAAAVIVPVVSVALLGLAAFIFLRKRRRNREEAIETPTALGVVAEKPRDYYGGGAALPIIGGATTAYTTASKAPQIQTVMDTSKAFPDTAYFGANMGAELPGDSAPPPYHSRNPSMARHTPSGSRSKAAAVVPGPSVGSSSNSLEDPFVTPSPTSRARGPFGTPEGSPVDNTQPSTIHNTTTAGMPIPFLLPRKSVGMNNTLHPGVSHMESREDFLSDNEYDEEEAEIGLAQRASVMRVPSVGSSHMLEGGRTSAERKSSGGDRSL